MKRKGGIPYFDVRRGQTRLAFATTRGVSDKRKNKRNIRRIYGSRGVKINPRARSNFWSIAAEVKAGDSGTEYGIDAVTPVGWKAVRRKLRAREYGYTIPEAVTNSEAFRNFVGGASEKRVAETLVQARAKLRAMLPADHPEAMKKNPRRRRSSEESRKMALKVANEIADITSATLSGPDRAYLISEVSARLNRSDLTGALSVAYQSAKAMSPQTTRYTLDRIAEELVRIIAQDYTTKTPPKFFRNPGKRRRPDPYAEQLRRIGKARQLQRTATPAPYLVQVKRGKRWISLAGFYSSVAAKDYAKALHEQYPRATLRVFETENEFKKNPAPLAESPRVQAAARRFKSFTGHDADIGEKVTFPDNPGVGLAIGPCLGVMYETIRDGRREKYIHRFRSKSRPLLATSHDGSSLYLLGGAYRFTARGIVDK